MAKFYQGFFKPKNPQKYKGDPTKIIYRSFWECKYMSWLDNNDDIIYWQSEEIYIPYRSPKDNKVHRYFPDFIVWMKNKLGIIEIFMIEIKPKGQTLPPKNTPKKKKATYIKEVMTYGINEAKWNSAKEYCLKNNMTFQILSEKELGI